MRDKNIFSSSLYEITCNTCSMPVGQSCTSKGLDVFWIRVSSLCMNSYNFDSSYVVGLLTLCITLNLPHHLIHKLLLLPLGHQSNVSPFTSKILVWFDTLSTRTIRPSESSWSLFHDPTYHAHKIWLIRSSTIYRDIKNHFGNTHIWCRIWFTYDVSRLDLQSTFFNTNCNTLYNII